ncbi:hypothetical protein HY025_00945 [Candidatus Daviesbacteria bacterium]|nr:hypothetical protein [Candidatus Daviesbacteria bacterium]
MAGDRVELNSQVRNGRLGSQVSGSEVVRSSELRFGKGGTFVRVEPKDSEVFDATCSSVERNGMVNLGGLLEPRRTIWRADIESLVNGGDELCRYQIIDEQNL